MRSARSWLYLAAEWTGCFVLALSLIPAATAAAAQRKPARPNPRQISAAARNAACIANGGRVILIQMRAGRDRRNAPEDAIDGNVHTRPVLWDPPYALRIELVDKLPITQLNFILDDYAGEAWPKDLEITLSDGSKLTKTLELLRPERGKPAPRQSLAIGKEISWFEVKVLNYAPGTQVIAGMDVDNRDRVLIRRTGREAVFASIINPYKDLDVVASVEPLAVEGPVGSCGLKVKRADGGADLIVVRLDPQIGSRPAAASTFPGGSTDALVSVVRLNTAGEPIETHFAGGTSRTYGGKNLGVSLGR